MIVSELIEYLEKQDQDRVVILHSDDEGNDYREMNGFWLGFYKDGEAGQNELTDEMIEEGYDEEDLIDGEKAIIFD